MRSVIACALLAVASANISDDAHETAITNSENEQLIAQNTATLNGLKSKITLAEDSFKSTSASVRRVELLANTVMDMDTTVSTMVQKANDKAMDDASRAEQDLSAETMSIMKSLREAATKVRKDMAEAKSNTEKAFGARTDQVVKKFNTIKGAVQTSSDYVEKLEECANDGKTVDKNGNCATAAISDSSAFTSINYRTWRSQTDGRDHGHINGRHINFKKLNDDTALKIIYYDNMRVHGHTAHAMWEVQFCDASGNGCSNCNQPGRIMHWRWSGHQHNWWVNDHFGGELYGLCTKADNKDLKKGDYQIRIRLHHNRYDIHTGHGGQHGHIQVEEVMLAQ